MKRFTPRLLAELAVFHGACQKISELAPLVALLRRRKLNTIVEIGTCKGGTFWLWCQIAQPGATIISIDLPGGNYGGGYSQKEAIKFSTYRKGTQKLHFIRKDSHKLSTFDSLRKNLDGRKIDFLFIDGDHHYSGVKKDFQLYGSLVRSRGLVAIHDIIPHTKIKTCKVDQFWHEIKRSYHAWEFKDLEDDRGWGCWGGIGVLSYRKIDR